MYLSPLYRAAVTLTILWAVAITGFFAARSNAVEAPEPAAPRLVQLGYAGHGKAIEPRQDVLDAIAEADARTAVSYR